MASSAAAGALPLSIQAFSSSTRSRNNRRLGEFTQIVRKDREFISQKLRWVKAWLPSFSKPLEDFFWLRGLEDHRIQSRPQPQWPKPSYPELSGMDLLMADLMALKAYADYLHQVSKIWSTPLPEFYEPQKVADYFSCRPHIVIFRVLEVFSSFTTAMIKMRTSGIFKFNRFDKKRENDRKSSEYYFGQLLKETMLNLGPTFIKVGQSLSTRPDIIGMEIAKALSELHDQIPPFPNSAAMKIIEEELGCSIESIFTSISKEPVAAASFGQVYRGVTCDGHTVAIKVQRPNLLHAVVRDIYILRFGLGLLQRVAKRKSDPRLYADELGRGLVGELDYTLEATNASEFLDAHRQFPFIHVPKVFRHLTRKRILTMEWVVGENPRDLLFLSQGSYSHGVGFSERRQLEAKKHLLDLVNKGVEATLVQLLETGILHADPHAGNLRYMPTGQIGFLDFGLLCRMERKHQFAMLASILHIVYGDWAALVYDLTEMDVVRPGTNLRRVTMELEDALGEVEFKDGIPDIKFSRVLGKIFSVALKYHFRMPPYYTLVLRSLASLEGLAVAADPNFKTFQAAYPYVVRKLLTDNSAPTRRILHSVVFNEQKEFQWQKLGLFIRVGAARKSVHKLFVSNPFGFPEYSANGLGEYQVANLVMRLLLSEDGAVLRRLLVTANAHSLAIAMMSEKGVVFRRHVRSVLGDIICRWMINVLGSKNTIIACNSASNMQQSEMRPLLEPSTSLHLSILRDRRLRLIFNKFLSSIRKDPVLMIRFCWNSFLLFVSAFLLGCQRSFATMLKALMVSISTAPKVKQVAVNV